MVRVRTRLAASMCAITLAAALTGCGVMLQDAAERAARLALGS